MKPAKLRGIASTAMVLCATSDDKDSVELLAPPVGAKVMLRVKMKNIQCSLPGK